ncbi:hypothetical protein ACH4U6_34865 [Streptomyces netropsis]|uniref:hypothetical protein n=1 Tax=Streptomyces netropsis TaxID=55404 RepID=UPI0037A449DA
MPLDEGTQQGGCLFEGAAFSDLGGTGSGGGGGLLRRQGGGGEAEVGQEMTLAAFDPAEGWLFVWATRPARQDPDDAEKEPA